MIYLQENVVQAARSPGLRQRRGLPQRRVYHPLRQLGQADLPRRIRTMNWFAQLDCRHTHYVQKGIRPQFPNCFIPFFLFPYIVLYACQKIK